MLLRFSSCQSVTRATHVALIQSRSGEQGAARFGAQPPTADTPGWINFRRREDCMRRMPAYNLACRRPMTRILARNQLRARLCA